MFPAVSSKTKLDGDSPASNGERSWNAWSNNLTTHVDASLQNWDIGAKRQLSKLLDGLHKAVGRNISTHADDIKASTEYAAETSMVESLSKPNNLTEPVDVTQAYRYSRRDAYGCSVPNNYRIYSIQLKDQRAKDKGLHEYSKFVGYDVEDNPILKKHRRVYDQTAEDNGLHEHLLIVSFDAEGNPSPIEFVSKSHHDDETTFTLSKTSILKGAVADLQLVEKALKTPETTKFLEPLKLAQEFATLLPEKLKESGFYRDPNPGSNERGPQYLNGNSPWLGRFLLVSLPAALKSTLGLTTEDVAEKIREADTLGHGSVVKREFNDNLSRVNQSNEAQTMAGQVLTALNACGFDDKFKPFLEASRQNILRFKREIDRQRRR
jgi:hypothetical protein